MQLAHFKRGSCRRLSHAGDGTCCHMFPRSASVRLLRKQLWRLDHSHLNGCLPQSLSESALTILQKQAGPCSPGPVALWPSFFAFRVCFCVSNPPYQMHEPRKPGSTAKLGGDSPFFGPVNRGHAGQHGMRLATKQAKTVFKFHYNYLLLPRAKNRRFLRVSASIPRLSLPPGAPHRAGTARSFH